MLTIRDWKSRLLQEQISQLAAYMLWIFLNQMKNRTDISYSREFSHQSGQMLTLSSLFRLIRDFKHVLH